MTAGASPLFREKVYFCKWKNGWNDDFKERQALDRGRQHRDPPGAENPAADALQAGAKQIGIRAWLGKDDEVVIQVANDGEPIPVSAQEQLFDPLYTKK